MFICSLWCFFCLCLLIFFLYIVHPFFLALFFWLLCVVFFLLVFQSCSFEQGFFFFLRKFLRSLFNLGNKWKFFLKKNWRLWTSEKISFLFFFCKNCQRNCWCNKQFCPDLICGNFHVFWTSIKMSSLFRKVFLKSSPSCVFFWTFIFSIISL